MIFRVCVWCVVVGSLVILCSVGVMNSLKLSWLFIGLLGK